MSQRKPCKYFAEGACWRGDHCKFPHVRKESPKRNICTFYQKGNCTYGSRCKYEHVKSSWVASGAAAAGASSSSRSPHRCVVLNSVPASIGSSRDGKKLEDISLCLFHGGSTCPNGDKCSSVHGDLCPTCGKLCLHPFRADEREEHLKSCEKNQKYLEALKLSEEIECSVCLDRVLSKPTAAERKFAVLPECDHPFCISCIKNWRNGSPSSGMALRACPICRITSHFVIPSHVWYSSKEEKQEIIDNYKARLRLIDCKHFNFGNGNCQFGDNCFYKHTVMPGSYVWKHHKPPPRRPMHRGRFNPRGMDDAYDFTDPLNPGLLDMFDDFVDDYDDYYDNYCDPFHEDYLGEYFDEDGPSPFDMVLFLAGMECDDVESDIDSGDDDDYY